MMKFSERRARERAAKISHAAPMEVAGAAVGDFRREIAHTISLIDRLSRQYAGGAVTARQDSAVTDWAATAGPTFARLANDLSTINADLLRVIDGPNPG